MKNNKEMPYKIKDAEGNIFVFKGYESGFPVYRTIRGCKVIFENDIQYYEIIEQNSPNK
jgi:hypothetical protein